MSTAQKLPFFGRLSQKKTQENSSGENKMSQLLSNIESLLHSPIANYEQFAQHMNDLQKLAQDGNECAAQEYVKLYKEINKDAIDRIFPSITDEQLITLTIKPVQFDNYMRACSEKPRYSM